MISFAHEHTLIVLQSRNSENMTIIAVYSHAKVRRPYLIPGKDPTESFTCLLGRCRTYQHFVQLAVLVASIGGLASAACVVNCNGHMV